MENEREVLVEVNHLNVIYGSGKKAYEAVQDANFKIYKGGDSRQTPYSHDAQFHG